MGPMGQLIVTETRLQFRDRGVVAFGLLFPAVLLLLLGFVFPGFRDPNPDLGGGRPVDLYSPIMLVLVLVMVGITTIAGVLAAYRHDGILRRLRTTPVGPARLLAAQLVAQLVIAAIGIALAIVAALGFLEVPGPQHWPGILAALLLTAVSMFAIGLVIGSAAPSASAAQGISTVTWLPIMVLAGLWFPREGMPDTMRRISDWAPGGAGVDAVQQAWFHGVVSWSSLTALAVTAIVLSVVAALTFRWE
jgi:ABC-2 type transport system permease protein